jgi:nuclear GTP-binding protein
MHSITVGVLGFPNVGKSSLINSLKRCRAVSVKNTPGSTQNLQEIKIDKNITLIDSPGVVLEGINTVKDSLVLSSIIDYNQIDDCLLFIDKILKNKSKLDLMEELDIPDWEDKIKFGKAKKGDMAESTREQERKDNLRKIFKESANLETFNSDTTMKFL